MAEKMMTEAETQRVLQAAELLVQKEDYELALELLKPMECVMASWMKGKIYLVVANNIFSSFQFKNYRTKQMENEYRELLSIAYEHLYKAGCQLPTASLEIQERLNSSIWQEIGQVENELARTRPQVDKQSCGFEEDDYDDIEDFNMNQKHHIESMIDQVEFWSL